MFDAANAGAHGVGGAFVAVRVRLDGNAAPRGPISTIAAELVFVEQEVARVGVGEARLGPWHSS